MDCQSIPRQIFYQNKKLAAGVQFKTKYSEYDTLLHHYSDMSS